jgi:GrpB-like predicted nucleotidyltransferase (UPF0157 family)
MFRDRLRASAADRDLYADTKLALARRQWDSAVTSVRTSIRSTCCGR